MRQEGRRTLVVGTVERKQKMADGKTASGRFYQPPGTDTEATPAIVIFHGQKSRWSHRFRPHVQLLASLGYAVLLAACPVDGWSHDEHAVFAAAGQWLAQQDGIAANRVAAYGHSHGGYNVYMQAVQYPEVWDAFVADTGCVDLHTAKPVGNLHRQLGDPEDNAQVYQELSPMTYVGDTVGSPLLMIHGADDGWADQPRIFEQALQDNGWTDGDEYEYIELPGVGHTPKSREMQIQWWQAIIDFLHCRLSG